MSLSSTQIDHRRRTFRIDHEPTCDRCGHGASLHTLDTRYPCIGCGERASIGLAGRPVCVGFASAWFDNSTRRAAARTR